MTFGRLSEQTQTSLAELSSQTGYSPDRLITTFCKWGKNATDGDGNSILGTARAISPRAVETISDELRHRM